MADHEADHSTPCAAGGTPVETASVSSIGPGEAREREAKGSGLRTRTPSRRRRWLRSLLVLLALIPVLALGLYWVATRSWFIIAAITPALEQRLGGEIGIGSAKYEGDGTFRLTDFRLRVRGMHGLGAEVLRVGDMEVQVSMDKLFDGDVEVLSARVEDLHLRASEDINAPGEFNFMQLRHALQRDPDADSLHVPHVEIASAVLEMGAHAGGEYTVIGRRRVAGQMHRIDDSDSVFSFELGEIDAHGNGLGEQGIVVNGQWNSRTFAYVGRIDGLKLDENTRSMCPQSARFYWDRMELEGSVGSASVEFREGEPLTASLNLENVGLTMPVHVEGLWSIYRAGEVIETDTRPRMQVRKGTLKLIGERLELDIAGAQPNRATVEVPFRLKLVVPELPKLDWSRRSEWLDAMLATMPFEMSLRLDDFQFEPTAGQSDPSLELPTAVARMFALFEMTGWQLSTQIDVSRAVATVQADGSLEAPRINSTGRAFIRHASGRYRRFPYQLTDVDAYVEFDNEMCKVHYLNGRGAGDATVRISGTVSPPSREGAVDLRIDATNVPLDERLRHALAGRGGDVFDAMFPEAALSKLADAGLVRTPEAIDAMRKSLAELAARRGALAGAAASDERAERDRAAQLAAMDAELARMAAIIDAGPFALGGMVDLDLKVQKQRGRGNPAVITGGIDIQSAGVLYAKFPYPITFTAGALDWQPGEVRIVTNDQHKGLAFTTAGGGRGVLTGRLHLRHGDSGPTVALPELAVTMSGDAINPVLLSAFPSGDADGARGRATRLLHSLGLTGDLDCTGRIEAQANGELHYEMLVGLKRGASSPMPDVAQVMAELGLRWPEGFSLSDVEGVVRVGPGHVELVELRGRRGEGVIVAKGALNLAPNGGAASLEVEFQSLALEQYLVNLAPAEGVQKAHELWERYQPQGTFDATLRYTTDEQGRGSAEIVVRPNVLRIMVQGQPVSLIRRSGELTLQGDEVRFNALELEVQTGSRADGTLVLNGSYGASEAGQTLAVAGAWMNGMFECSLIPEVMRLIGATGEADRYAALVPAGSFDATFDYRSPRGEEPATYAFEMKPRSVAMVVSETVLSATLAPSSTISITPGEVRFRDVRGEHAGGAFELDGSIALGAEPVIDLDLEYRGDLVNQQVWVMLPQPVRDTMREIGFESSQAGRVSDAHLRLAQQAGSERWGMEFTGQIETGSCSFNVGVPFSEVDGVFRVHAHQPAGGEATVRIEAEAHRLRVLNRPMTNLSALMTYSESEHAVTVRDMRAELYGGVVSAEGFVGVGGGRRDYDMRVVAAGVLLDQISSAESLAASSSERVQMEDRLGSRAAHDGATGANEEDAATRGQLFASLDLAGERGRDFTRTGRGKLRIVGGEVANLSLTLRVLQLMQFIPPFADTMDYADVDYYVSGDRVVFERILLEIPFMDRAALQLHGEGEMDFDTFELNTRFRSRGTIPMLSALVGEVSDRLYQIEVTGPLTDPVARLRALPDFSSSRGSAGRAERIVQGMVE